MKYSCLVFKLIFFHLSKFKQMNNNDIIALAGKYGIQIVGDIVFNEMGIDFKVGFASDTNGRRWVLRIPRRKDLAEQIQREQRILQLVKEYTTVPVPDWQIANHDLIAYPMLQDSPALTFDAETYAVTWNMNPQDARYVISLAEAMVQLHQIPLDALSTYTVKSLTIDEVRQEIRQQIQTVKQEIGIGSSLERRWLRWVDNDRLWPSFTSFVHGDLYAGHVLVNGDADVTGLIDWSEGQGNDPAMDFAGHVAAFGEQSLKDLIDVYQQKGGRIWDTLFEQVVERHAASALRYAIFALMTKDEMHLTAVKAQLEL